MLISMTWSNLKISVAREGLKNYVGGIQMSLKTLLSGRGHVPLIGVRSRCLQYGHNSCTCKNPSVVPETSETESTLDVEQPMATQVRQEVAFSQYAQLNPKLSVKCT